MSRADSPLLHALHLFSLVVWGFFIGFFADELWRLSVSSSAFVEIVNPWQPAEPARAIIRDAATVKAVRNGVHAHLAFEVTCADPKIIGVRVFLEQPRGSPTDSVPSYMTTVAFGHEQPLTCILSMNEYLLANPWKDADPEEPLRLFFQPVGPEEGLAKPLRLQRVQLEAHQP